MSAAEHAVNATAGARMELDVLAEMVPMVDDGPTLAGLLLFLRDLRALLAECYAEAEKQLLAAMGEGKRLEVPGLGVFEAKASKRRTQWDNDALLRDLRPHFTYDQDTGEELSASQAIDLLSAVYRLAGSNVRVTQAKSLLGEKSLDQWCQEEGAGWSVVLPAVDPERKPQ